MLKCVFNKIGLVFFIFYFFSCKYNSNREIISFDGPWSFCIDSTSIGDSVKWAENGLPEKLIRTTTVPHTWNTEKGLEKYWGKCWYERKFEISKPELQKISRLQFDGVYHDALIYINGKIAGAHIGSGYTRFFINITSYLEEGTNTLIVCADNSPSRNNIPFLKSFDWANDGGIYRSVYLVITQPQAIKNIHVIASPVGEKGTAKIKISFIDPGITELINLSLNATIREENQNTHKRIYNGILEGKIEQGCFISTLNFDNIKKWHFDSPNLYKLTVKLRMDGVEMDEYSTVFGFRKIEVENKRFVLNGEPIRLMGVEWMPGSNLERGMAETHTDFEKNLKLMKNANCIFTRFHWQQDEYIFDWCDRNGIMVQEEIPYWGPATMINDTLLNKGIQHLDEMIDAHYNHPSIISWGIGNELSSLQPTVLSNLKILYKHAKSLDSSRLVNYVSNKLHKDITSEGSDLTDESEDTDMLMFNEYFSTWYGKGIEVVPGELDKIAYRYPKKPLIISEWGICEPVHKGGDARRSKEMTQQILIYGSKPYISGAIYFCLNDYRTHMGEDFTYTYPQRVHGVCDINLNSKPSYDTLKNLSSPIIVKSAVANNKIVRIKLSGKTGIPSYIVRNYYLMAGDKKIQIDELRPGDEKTFEIKTDSNKFAIFRPTGIEVIQVKFRK